MDLDVERPKFASILCHHRYLLIHKARVLVHIQRPVLWNSLDMKRDSLI